MVFIENIARLIKYLNIWAIDSIKINIRLFTGWHGRSSTLEKRYKPRLLGSDSIVIFFLGLQSSMPSRKECYIHITICHSHRTKFKLMWLYYQDTSMYKCILLILLVKWLISKYRQLLFYNYLFTDSNHVLLCQIRVFVIRNYHTKQNKRESMWHLLRYLLSNTLFSHVFHI